MAARVEQTGCAISWSLMHGKPASTDVVGVCDRQDVEQGNSLEASGTTAKSLLGGGPTRGVPLSRCTCAMDFPFRVTHGGVASPWWGERFFLAARLREVHPLVHLEFGQSFDPTHTTTCSSFPTFQLSSFQSVDLLVLSVASCIQMLRTMPFAPPFKRRTFMSSRTERSRCRASEDQNTEITREWINVHGPDQSEAIDNLFGEPQKASIPRLSKPGKVIKRLKSKLKSSRKRSHSASASEPSTIKLATESSVRALHSNASKGLHWKAFQERNTFIGLTKDHAAQRQLLKELLQKISPHHGPQRRSSEPYSTLDQVTTGGSFSVSDDINKILVFLDELEADLEDSNQRLQVVERRLDTQHKADVSTTSSVFTSDNAITQVHEDDSDLESTSTGRPTLVREYYHEMGEIGLLSNELLSLGPRPKPPALRAASDDRNFHLDVSTSDDFTPREYAQRHLRLVEGLKLAQAKAAHLKGLCQEAGFDIDDMDLVGDEIYREAVDALTTGPPMIDSLLVLQQNDTALGTPGAPELGTYGIEDWFAGLDPTSLAETSADDSPATPCHDSRSDAHE